MKERSVSILATAYSILLISGRCSAFTETSLSSDYMICRPVSGIFDSLAQGKIGTDKGILPALQGPDGPAGQPGKTGLQGPRGEPDYQKVHTIVQERMQSLNARLYRLEADLRVLRAGGGSTGYETDGVQPTQSPEDAKNAEECMKKFNAPINIGKTCYSIIGGEGLLWTFHLAESNCTKLHGYLADLDSRDLYDKIYNYIDRTYSTVVQAWTGMRYENEKLIKTDGNQASFVKWMAYNPRKSSNSYSSYYSSYTYVYVNVDTSSRINGLQNTPPSRKLAYAICHFDLSGEVTTRRSTTKQTTTTDPYYGDYDDYYDGRSRHIIW